ncbi:hypothetical protein C8J57DRAFT_1619589 [Mycena rebaudengoi]|nr:hypothetical protein C8J57DRAFT_1619589 [Mycena rebaudengoi]
MSSEAIVEWHRGSSGFIAYSLIPRYHSVGHRMGKSWNGGGGGGDWNVPAPVQRAYCECYDRCAICSEKRAGESVVEFCSHGFMGTSCCRPGHTRHAAETREPGTTAVRRCSKCAKGLAKLDQRWEDNGVFYIITDVKIGKSLAQEKKNCFGRHTMPLMRDAFGIGVDDDEKDHLSKLPQPKKFSIQTLMTSQYGNLVTKVWAYLRTLAVPLRYQNLMENFHDVA